MDEDAGGRLRPGRLAAVLAGAVLLAAAGCGGSSPSSSPGASHGLPSAAMLDSFAACVRGHGVPNFYFSRDRYSGGDTPDNLLKIGPWVAPGNPNSPQFQAALKACNHLLPMRQLSPAQQQSILHRLLKQAACIRAHGFPDYPDPSANSNGIVQPPLPSGIDPSSRQFQAAQQSCSGG
jgi:hypothetical protein